MNRAESQRAGALISGVSPVIEVPFNEDGTVDHDSFDRLLTHLIATGVSSMMFPGFASEFHKLADDERSRLHGQFLAHTAAAEGVRAIVSVPDHATELAVRRAVAAVECGADVINILPPFFLSPPPTSVCRHIRTVLRAVAPIPVIVQYAPAQTGAGLTVDVLDQLREECPNLVGVKVESQPPGRLVTALRERAPELFALVGYGGVQLPDAVARGAAGVQPGCSFVELYLDIWDRYRRGESRRAEEQHARLLPYLAYWMQHVELIIAAEKLISFRRGLIASPTCRAPGWRLDDREVAVIEQFLSQFADQLHLEES